MRAFLNQERVVRLRKFWPTNEPIKVLAAEWGCTISYISVKAKELGLPSRQIASTIRRKFDLSRFGCASASREYFEAEAERRNLHPRELEALIIQTISNDRMVDAILDDADELEVSH